LLAPYHFFWLIVPWAGIEPARREALDFESSVFTTKFP